MSTLSDYAQSSMRKLDKHVVQANLIWLVYIIVAIELLVHALFVTRHRAVAPNVNHPTHHAVHDEAARLRMLAFLANSTTDGAEINMILAANAASKPSPLRPDMLNASYPELFIFRRTKKTGSSSMMNALMDVLEPLGYVPLARKRDEIHIAVRNEYARVAPRRLAILQHNNLTRSTHPRRRAVIADTIRDGLPHIMSYCRYMRGVYNCVSSGMRACLQDASTLQQMHYRWAGRDHEDDDTYIDLPLSSAHPALSTAVLRSVFPMIPPLKVMKYNARGAGCENELKKVSDSERKERGKNQLQQIYDDLYGPLDRQVDQLKRRMLSIAGYPSVILDDRNGTNEELMASGSQLSELLDEAERLEANKTNPDEFVQHKVLGKSDRVLDLLSQVQKWMRHENGSLDLIRRRDI